MGYYCNYGRDIRWLAIVSWQGTQVFNNFSVICCESTSVCLPRRIEFQSVITTPLHSQNFAMAPVVFFLSACSIQVGPRSFQYPNQHAAAGMVECYKNSKLSGFRTSFSRRWSSPVHQKCCDSYRQRRAFPPELVNCDMTTSLNWISCALPMKWECQSWL